MPNNSEEKKWKMYLRARSPYRVYGVQINVSSSGTTAVYTDDAEGMVAGSSAWDETNLFKKIRPCLLKDGKVQYYLDKNNFTLKEDGTASDITSGDDGDVMIEIPKIGYKISYRYPTYTIQITDNPDAGAEGFRYYAHTRAVEGDKDKLYIGAYLAARINGKTRSLSGKAVTTNTSLYTFRGTVPGDGSSHYGVISFYPYMLLQCLYLIRFANLDSQGTVGVGYVHNTNTVGVLTGGTSDKGMFYGDSTGKTQVKCFGIEDLWGHHCSFLDGIRKASGGGYEASYDMKNFIKIRDTSVSSGSSGMGRVASVIGNTECGFIPSTFHTVATNTQASEYNKYFCDYGRVSTSSAVAYTMVGSHFSDYPVGAGIFHITMARVDLSAAEATTARLMYL